MAKKASVSAAIAVAAAEAEKVRLQEQVRVADKRAEEARHHSGTALGVGAAIVGVGAIVAEKAAEDTVEAGAEVAKDTVEAGADVAKDGVEVGAEDQAVREAVKTPEQI